MCNFEDGMRFCSCKAEEIKYREPDIFIRHKNEIIKKEHRKNKHIPLLYVWTLFRYAGETEGLEMGRYAFPSHDIGKGLNAEWVAMNLNGEECFDFDYEPQEGDNLLIRNNIKQSMAYLSFIYKNRAWEIDHYSPFEVEIEKFEQGKVEGCPKI